MSYNIKCSIRRPEPMSYSCHGTPSGRRRDRVTPDDEQISAVLRSMEVTFHLGSSSCCALLQGPVETNSKKEGVTSWRRPDRPTAMSPAVMTES